MSRLFAVLGHPVIVANARKLRAISQSQTKSDREDARMIARLGRADPQLLSPIPHRSAAGQSPTVTVRPFSMMIATLATPSALCVSAAH